MARIGWYVMKDVWGEPRLDYKGHMLSAPYFKGKVKSGPFNKDRERTRRCRQQKKQ